ncbi:hypothetical protein ALC53_03771 [Atta colombica]|uniref:Uncharacterized protein n=1 Tax=Atta colombica TaxID=520822 RepID=A0A195BNN7_9HYME|nr:hypothetical protein ALC53_03771 [Atta colombica]
MRPPRLLTTPPLPLVLYVSVLKRAPLCVIPTLLARPTRAFVYLLEYDITCLCRSTICDLFICCHSDVHVHREERARTENTKSHVEAHKSIPGVGGGPRRALSSIDRYLNEYSSAKLQEKGSYSGIKLITPIGRSENLRRASFSKATAERIPLPSSPAENFFVSCIYKESNYENFEVLNVRQFTITCGFPARSAIREIGADYAFQIDRENSSGYKEKAAGYVSGYLSYDRHSSCIGILLDTTNIL